MHGYKIYTAITPIENPFINVKSPTMRGFFVFMHVCTYVRFREENTYIVISMVYSFRIHFSRVDIVVIVAHRKQSAAVCLAQ
jgi:hypothetical protein